MRSHKQKPVEFYHPIHLPFIPPFSYFAELSAISQSLFQPKLKFLLMELQSTPSPGLLHLLEFLLKGHKTPPLLAERQMPHGSIFQPSSSFPDHPTKQISPQASCYLRCLNHPKSPTLGNLLRTAFIPHTHTNCHHHHTHKLTFRGRH